MQTKETMYRTVYGMDEAFRDRLVAGLNQNLANLTDLAAAYKQAHWNVIGQDFSQLHELFDQFTDQTREYMDPIAERAVAIGGIARGTLHVAAQETTLAPFPVEERSERVLLEELLKCVDQVDAGLRDAMNGSEGDLVTQDIYINVTHGIEKQRWMLQAHLAGPGHNSGRS